MRTTSGSVAARRHEVGDANDAVGAVEVELVDERAVAVAAFGVLHLALRSEQPATVPLVPEQAAKHACESKRGKQSQSIEPLRPTSAAVWRSPIRP